MLFHKIYSWLHNPTTPRTSIFTSFTYFKKQPGVATFKFISHGCESLKMSKKILESTHYSNFSQPCNVQCDFFPHNCHLLLL